MLRKFAIKEENSSYPLWAVLTYDEEQDIYGADIPEDIDPEDEEAISDYISDVTGFCHNGFALDPEPMQE